jgi:8-oxo-dGTP diphosphatase
MSAQPTTEAEFLAAYDQRAYPPFAVTVDIALFTIRDGGPAVLLIRRGVHPYQGAWALPGGFVRKHESIDQAAARELEEETGVTHFGGHLEQLKTYGAPDRDPRGRVVSVAYLAIAPTAPEAMADSDADLARYWHVHDLGLERRRQRAPQLAFDHKEILAEALERVRAKLEYTPLATSFLPAPFTLGALRRVYEAVWGTHLDPGNFQRKALHTPGFVQPTDQISAAGRSGGRPAHLYQPGPATVLNPPLLRRLAAD